ncbi:hypothetical protein [Methylobacterium sp. 285MFTsu5.1]|uniref:hypothetical protein n=1 Tax=Methylobacterium sp. 285MFTsu5.1 TaxID=1172187 RepID=UPI00047C6223|nr:hypothetical protein [Methylobacterium sp. 285MFTsu5.1]
MNAPIRSPERAAMLAHTFEAIAEAAGIAETYARTAADMAAIGDSRGVNYALRQAAIALSSAADTAATLRPAGSRGGA